MMATEELRQLIDELQGALAKGHKGFTVRGAQMNLLLEVLTEAGAAKENGAHPQECTPPFPIAEANRLGHLD